MQKKFSIVIPARLESSRLPRKILLEIGGEPMLYRVWKQATKMSYCDEIIIATDSQEVFDRARAWGAEVKMTPKDCNSGTERIVSLISELSGDFILNIQGDEPFIPEQLLNALVARWLECNCDVVTPVREITSVDELFDDNLVKVVRAYDGRALYFSRSAIPHARNHVKEEWLSVAQYWAHVGVYGYKREVLLGYASLAESLNEQIERLEQLRLLENGFQIQTLETKYQPIGVDTIDDLQVAREYYDKHGDVD